MNSKRFLLYLAPVLLLVALGLANQRRINSAAYVLGQYSPGQTFGDTETQNWPFVYVRDAHLKYKPEFGREGQTTLIATWFEGNGPKQQMSCFIDGAGRTGWSGLDWVFSPRSVLPKTVGHGSHCSTLTNANFLHARSLLEEMPPSSRPSRQWDIVIVTFNQGLSYETRVYDRAALPQVLQELFELTGAPSAAKSN